MTISCIAGVAVTNYAYGIIKPECGTLVKE